MTGTDRIRRRPSSLEVGRAERALVLLAAMLAALAGLVDAIGFLAFGQVFLASPDAGTTVLGVTLGGGYTLMLFAGAMVLSFVGGVVLTTLLTFRSRQFRRTLVLALATFTLCAAFAALSQSTAYLPAVLLAMAIGGAHCTFERDDPALHEALSPSAQLGRFGEALARGRAGSCHQRLGLHASFWLAFLMGGISGAVAWTMLGGNACLLAAVMAAILTIRAWLIERDLIPA